MAYRTSCDTSSIKSTYVAIEFKTSALVWVLRSLYTENFPGKRFGHPDPCVLIILRENLPLVRKHMVGLSEESAFSMCPEKTYRIFPVFLDDEVSEELKPVLRSYFPYAVADTCKVCGIPMFSGSHKHILQHCDTCGKETEHSTPFFGSPFRCTEH